MDFQIEVEGALSNVFGKLIRIDLEWNFRLANRNQLVRFQNSHLFSQLTSLFFLLYFMFLHRQVFFYFILFFSRVLYLIRFWESLVGGILSHSVICLHFFPHFHFILMYVNVEWRIWCHCCKEQRVFFRNYYLFFLDFLFVAGDKSGG